MAPNGQPAGLNRSTKWFDSGLALRLCLALVTSIVAIPLICTIIGAPVGLALFAAGCKPLKNYMTEKADQQAVAAYARQLQQRRKKP
jgi:hypothetical protein